MRYENRTKLRDGRELVLRSCTPDDAEALLKVFIQTLGETDNLLIYPDECEYTTESEAQFLKGKQDSERECEILAFLDGRLVGTAGITAVGTQIKLRHRASFGVCILKEFWGLGIGEQLVRACIDSARKAGYIQLELDVVADNARALALYKKLGFEEYGRNPKGFLLRTGECKELVYMKKEL